ncbi:hypothetical protein [Aurantiacibacter sp. MUD61]|uniref:hypothetical protein n=1 Tax=Aurantiacibacter sp. MUD61 TaxID=3009083 RepID=UPI0022F00580|nr:hypothetical protein [Aurantiacibacter sp. MUD61]
MRLILASAAIAMLAACGSSENGTIEGEDGTAAYNVDNDGDGAEIRFTDNDGNETVVETGSNSEVDLPAGFTIYPGAEVVSNTSVSGEQGDGTMIIMTSSASRDDLVAFYREQAEGAGIDINMSMESGDMNMIGGEGDGSMFFSFTASTSDGETSGMLTVGRQP